MAQPPGDRIFDIGTATGYPRAIDLCISALDGQSHQYVDARHGLHVALDNAAQRLRCDGRDYLLDHLRLLADVWSIWRTSTHSISLVYILAGTALFAAALRKGWRAPNMIVISAALGSGFNFLDFLITPPMMPMLLAFFVLLDSRRELGTLALTVVFAWFFGYSETWIAKWALAYFAMPESAGVAKDILSTIEFRTVGAFNGVDLVPLAATAKAFLRAVDRIEVVVPAIFVLAIAHYATTASRIDWRRALWLSCPVLVSVLWFEALSSHTQQHVSPSSRSAVVAVAIVLSAILMAMQRRPSMPDLWAHLGMLRTKLSRFRANARSK